MTAYRSRAAGSATRLFAGALLGLLACKSPEAPPAPAPDAGLPAAPPPDPFADFPLHGSMQGLIAIVRKTPAPDGVPLGWLRRGERVRLKPAPQDVPGCKGGFYAIAPRGFVCAGDGVQVGERAGAADSGHADRTAALPYAAYFVKEWYVPEFHELPSRDQLRVMDSYVEAVKAASADPKLLAQLLAGELKDAPRKPGMLRRLLDRGFYVAATGQVKHEGKAYVRTVRGTFLREPQLQAMATPKFAGVELTSALTLPVAWVVRGATPLRAVTSASGATELVEAADLPPIARLTRLTNWQGPVHLGNKLMHALADGTYLRPWYVAVAEALPRPREVKADEPWLHVDLSAQTLVLYQGDTPRYATLVSTGVPEHPSNVGSFRIQRKYVSDGMSDIGADVDQRYSIDDVPWTQYFEGARALHGAFWHTHYGIQRSHGCINLSPNDALYVFGHTWPALPDGWHGISTQKTGEKGSLVVVTE